MAGNYSTLALGGIPATKSIVNAYTGAAVVSPSSIAATTFNNAKQTLTGALTAATLKTIETLTGPGQCAYLAAYSLDATVRMIRLVVIVDGVTVFDATSGSIGTNGVGVMAAGEFSSTGFPNQGLPIRYTTSLVVRVASNLTETDKVAVAIASN